MLLRTLGLYLFVKCSVVVESFLFNTTGRNETAAQFETVSFECVAGGLPAPTIRWLKDNLPIETRYTTRIEVAEEVIPSEQAGTEAIRSRLTLSDVVYPSDSGSYSCTADNDVGVPDVLSVPFKLDIEQRKNFWPKYERGRVAFCAHVHVHMRKH